MINSKDKQTGNPLSLVPTYTWNASVGYDINDKWDVNATYTQYGRQKVCQFAQSNIENLNGNGLSTLADSVEASLQKNMGETRTAHQAITTNTETAHAVSRYMQKSIYQLNDTAENLTDFIHQANSLTAKVAQMTETIAELNQAITDLPTTLTEQSNQAQAQAQQALTEIQSELQAEMKQQVTEIMTPIIEPINSLMLQLHREAEIHAHRATEQDRLLTQTQKALNQQQALSETVNSLDTGTIAVKIIMAVPFLAWVLAVISWVIAPVWGMVLMTLIAIGMTAGALLRHEKLGENHDDRPRPLHIFKHCRELIGRAFEAVRARAEAGRTRLAELADRINPVREKIGKREQQIIEVNNRTESSTKRNQALNQRIGDTKQRINVSQSLIDRHNRKLRVPDKYRKKPTDDSDRAIQDSSGDLQESRSWLSSHDNQAIRHNPSPSPTDTRLTAGGGGARIRDFDLAKILDRVSQSGARLGAGISQARADLAEQAEHEQRQNHPAFKP